jgi:hypothetical protein
MTVPGLSCKWRAHGTRPVDSYTLYIAEVFLAFRRILGVGLGPVLQDTYKLARAGHIPSIQRHRVDDVGTVEGNGALESTCVHDHQHPSMGDLEDSLIGSSRCCICGEGERI